MAKISKNVVDSDLRATVLSDLFDFEENSKEYKKINDRQYGTILVDLNGVERYVRIGVIVAEEREDMTARELMQSEIDLYEDTQKRKAEKAAKAQEKAKRDQEKREAKAKEKEAKGE